MRTSKPLSAFGINRAKAINALILLNKSYRKDIPMRSLFMIIMLYMFLGSDVEAQEEFNSDSANAYVEYLCHEVGPRVLGSAGELRALEWAVDKFRSFGADSSYVNRLNQFKGRRGPTNTNSGFSHRHFQRQQRHDYCRRRTHRF